MQKYHVDCKVEQSVLQIAHVCELDQHSADRLVL